MTEPHHPYPALFHAADRASVSAQRWYLTLSASRLWALVIVAGIAAFAGPFGQLAAVIALAPISLAVICEAILLIRRPEQLWYRSRSVAESTKSLAWRYQVGGRPIGLRMTQEEADLELTERLRNILKEYRELELPPAHQDQVTRQMRRLRSLPLKERIGAYGKDRIDDQRAWYAAKSDWNRRRANQFQIGLIVIELAAFGTAFFIAASEISFSAYSLLSALAIAGVGWLQIKQHRSIANSYALASHELAAISSTIGSINSETDWEEFVDRAEEAISREHTLWLASNSTHTYRE